MTPLLSALIAFLGANAALASLCGPSFNVRVSEVFNLGSGGFVYPVLALNLASGADPIRGAPAPVASSAYVLKSWYATDGTMLEAWTVHDLLKNLLHLQMTSLATVSVEVEWIELTKSYVTNFAGLNKHLAYLEFKIIA